MGHGIDKLADRFGDSSPPGVKFESSFLKNRPESTWGPYLDDTALCLIDGIGIGDTGLDKFNFARETGRFYKQGLSAAAGGFATLPSGQTVSDKDLGTLAYRLNELSEELRKADGDIQDTGHALNALLEKLVLTGNVNLGYRSTGSPETVADLLLSLTDDPAVAGKAGRLAKDLGKTRRSLLRRLDEPRMVTPLWDHQRAALADWIEGGHRGFVDMATATGKTVLGLAAIASRYGALHQRDQELLKEVGLQLSEHKATEKEDVLIVAHNNLILEQWRREFDKHLCIPPARTAQSDDSVVRLDWGRIHFRRPQGLEVDELGKFDLVILDEAHHYANTAGWGKLLKGFPSQVLALSGSVDDGTETTQSEVRDRLSRHIGPLIKEYTMEQARADGIVPDFEWAVYYTGFEGNTDELATTTATAIHEWVRFQARCESGEFSKTFDRPLSTHRAVRTVAQLSKAGRSAKAADKQFRNLATALSSRHMMLLNHTPELDAVIDLGIVHSNEKVVILTQKNAEAEEIARQLRSREAFPEEAIYHVHSSMSSSEQRDMIDEYDARETAAVLIGTGKQIGEGADIKSATVGINISKGSINRTLIQRIGRVLRNPNGDKQARFYNVVSMPSTEDTSIPTEDGIQLLEDVVQYRHYGDSLDEAPGFAASNEAVEHALAVQESAGANRILELRESGEYDDDDEDNSSDLLTETLGLIPSTATDASVILDHWGFAISRRETELQHVGVEPPVIDGTPETSEGDEPIDDERPAVATEETNVTIEIEETADESSQPTRPNERTDGEPEATESPAQQPDHSDSASSSGGTQSAVHPWKVVRIQCIDATSDGVSPVTAGELLVESTDGQPDFVATVPLTGDETTEVYVPPGVARLQATGSHESLESYPVPIMDPESVYTVHFFDT